MPKSFLQVLDADWRVLFCLARFAELRCPSELLSIRWVDVDWTAARLTIDSPKTGLRFCQMFPELPSARDANLAALKNIGDEVGWSELFRELKDSYSKN